MKAYIYNLLAWAEPAYRFVAETVVELAVLAARGLRWVLRVLLALLMFVPWLLALGARWLRHKRKDGG